MRRPSFLFFLIVILAVLAITWFVMTQTSGAAGATERLTFGSTLVRIERGVRLSEELKQFLNTRIGIELHGRRLGEPLEVPERLKNASVEELAAILGAETVLRVTSARIDVFPVMTVGGTDAAITLSRAETFLTVNVVKPNEGWKTRGWGDALGTAEGYLVKSRVGRGQITVSVTSREALERASLANAVARWFDGAMAMAKD